MSTLRAATGQSRSLQGTIQMQSHAESWVLKKREKQRVQAAGMRVLRKIAGVRRIDHVRNEDIRAQLRQEGVMEQVGRKREVWKKFNR